MALLPDGDTGPSILGETSKRIQTGVPHRIHSGCSASRERHRHKGN